MAKILNDEAIEAIKNNNQLATDVADALGIAWSAMPMTLQRKSRRLTEFAVLKVIADFLHCEMDDLLIDEPKVETSEDSKINTKKALP
jgi:DNA-binding Xre family transcriptional regulator